VNDTILGALNTKTDPKKEDIANQLYLAISRSREKIDSLIASKLNLPSMKKRQDELTLMYEASLADGSWRSTFPGRDILRRFTGRNASIVSYETFRTLIISAMQEAGYQPDGMKAVVAKILQS
jgi:hypothetical protein